jgi:glycosyltransferase involved in cell wall biosynthesis
MHGGSRAIATLLTELASDHAIALLYLRGRNEPGIDAAIHGACEIACEVPRPWSYDDRRAAKALRIGAGLAGGTPMWVRRFEAPEFSRQLLRVVNEWRPDILQFEFHVLGQYADVPALAGVARILVQHESGSTAAEERCRRLSGAPRVAAWADYRAWTGYEHRIASIVDRVVTFTERDAAALLGLNPRARIATIPIGVRVPPVPLSPIGTNGATILFVGSFVHYPNEDAAVRLATAILPLVHQRLPSATLEIVGSDPPPSISALAGTHVSVHGSVPDVEPYLHRAAMVAAPMRLGSGMRVKVLEALAAGKAVVCSPLAVDGLPVRDGSEVRLAETDQQFADTIVELLGAAGERRALALRARRWAEDHASARQSAASFRGLYETVLHERELDRGASDPSGIAVPVC